jgi:hypothetical protein
VKRVSVRATLATGVLCSGSRPFDVGKPTLCPMAARYYTHFVTSAEPAHSSEWSGVIELTHPLGERRDSKELRRLLAANFEIDAEDIKILQVARLH